ncbi:MAG: DAHL domain-containing protein [Cyanobacteria bacterium P01_C01_bin.69]
MKLPKQFSSRIFSRFTAIVVGGFLLLLLTFLFGQSKAPHINQHYQIVEIFRRLERTDIAIVNNVLKTQLSNFHNYDALVANHLAFDTQVTELKQLLSPAIKQTPLLQQKLQALEDQALDMDLLIEDFKSENAILKNSVNYFPKGMDDLLGQLGVDASQSQAAALLENIFIEILRYDTNNSPEITNNVRKLLAQIEALPANHSDALQISIEHICRHARTILRLKAEVNQSITRLTNASTGTAIEQLALAYGNHHQRLEQVKHRYHLWLYITAILLIATSLYLAWNYRNATVLRKINLNLGHLVTDRTQELQQTLEQLQVSQAQLIQAEKMSALGQLSAGIAHEINNPISFIHGNVGVSKQYSQDCLALLSLYEQHYPNPVEDIQDFIEMIDLDFLREDWSKLLSSMTTGTSRVKQIVSSLRNFSRLDESECKTVDLNEGIDSTLLLLNHRLAPSADLPSIKIVKTYNELPKVLCNPSAMNQVFMNILSNSIEAFVPGHLEPTITLTTEAEAEHVEISIADNGEGIPQEVQDKIFDPFFTSKPVGQGTGLGLTVCYQTIVKAHNGSIDVVSVPEEGTKFRIRLPLNRP